VEGGQRDFSPHQQKQKKRTGKENWGGARRGFKKNKGKKKNWEHSSELQGELQKNNQEEETKFFSRETQNGRVVRGNMGSWPRG